MLENVLPKGPLTSSVSQSVSQAAGSELHPAPPGTKPQPTTNNEHLQPGANNDKTNKTPMICNTNIVIVSATKTPTIAVLIVSFADVLRQREVILERIRSGMRVFRPSMWPSRSLLSMHNWSNVFVGWECV